MIRRQRTRTPRDTPATSSSIASRRIPVEKRGKPDKATQLIVKLPTLYQSPLSGIVERKPFRVQAPRPGHYLHVSDLLTKCIRKKALAYYFEVAPAGRRLYLTDILTFAQGDAIHNTLKAEFRESAPDMLWGKWSCKCEQLFHTEPCLYSDTDREEVCPHCNTHVDTYHEVSMFDEEFWIVGNPDVLFYMRAANAFHVGELKSIAPDQFKELNRPKPEHVLQVVFYWLLMHRLGYPLTDRVSVFYASKGYQFKGKPYREFLIDPQAELHRLDDMLEAAREHKASILSIQAEGEEVVLPVRVLCQSEDSKEAKKCELCRECFGVQE